jgi:hypothetical protein
MISKPARQQCRRARLLADTNVNRAHAAYQRPGIKWGENGITHRSVAPRSISR